MTSLDSLIDVRVKMKDVEKEINRFTLEAKKYMIASSVLVDLVEDSLQQIVLSRSISLGQTITQINDQSLLCETFNNSLFTMTEKTRSLVNKHIPDFLVLVCTFDKNVSDTQKYVIRDGIETIINSLKT